MNLVRDALNLQYFVLSLFRGLMEDRIFHQSIKLEQQFWEIDMSQISLYFYYFIGYSLWFLRLILI